jgi:hypothetical protein
VPVIFLASDTRCLWKHLYQSLSLTNTKFGLGGYKSAVKVPVYKNHARLIFAAFQDKTCCRCKYNCAIYLRYLWLSFVKLHLHLYNETDWPSESKDCLDKVMQPLQLCYTAFLHFSEERRINNTAVWKPFSSMESVLFAHGEASHIGRTVSLKPKTFAALLMIKKMIRLFHLQ